MDKREEELHGILYTTTARLDWRYSATFKELLDWQSRWSGRPTREQIVSTLKGTPIGDFYIPERARSLADRILALYHSTATERRVSKERIVDVLCHHDNKGGVCEVRGITELAEDLLALFNGDPKPKEVIWCPHLERKLSKGTFGGPKFRWFYRSNESDFGQAIADQWKVCPICGSKKPE